MKLSQLLSKTTKDVAAGEVSRNAILLTQAGYIDKLSAGVYSYLPLGNSVIQNISKIIKEEMSKVGAQEIYMPALHPKANWVKTGRWEKVDILFKTQSRWGSNEYCLGPTHEEIVVPLVGRFIQSYKDLPTAVYQIQTKFRDEARAKSGLLRGREFLMKDLYSFHATEENRAAYYEQMIETYKTIFNRCGFRDVYVTTAGGGSFTDKHSHEFQILTEAGEDLIYICDDCGYAENAEIAEARREEVTERVGCLNKKCPALAGLGCDGYPSMRAAKAIEIGNIFDLGTKFSEDFNLYYSDEQGKKHPVIIGCYGIGISRLMGALVEHLADDKGLVWPESVSPYKVYLTYFKSKKEPYNNLLPSLAEWIYQGKHDRELIGSIIYDDRDVSNGRKLADADLLGIPHRIILSERSLNTKVKHCEYSLEYKHRISDKSEIVGFNIATGGMLGVVEAMLSR